MGWHCHIQRTFLPSWAFLFYPHQGLRMGSFCGVTRLYIKRALQSRKSAVGLGSRTWAGRPGTVTPVFPPSLPHPVSPTLLSLTGPLPSIGGHLSVSAESSPYFMCHGHQGPWETQACTLHTSFLGIHLPLQRALWELFF